MLEGYAVYDLSGNVIPVTICVSSNPTEKQRWQDRQDCLNVFMATDAGHRRLTFHDAQQAGFRLAAITINVDKKEIEIVPQS